jgi:hypothetical protein
MWQFLSSWGDICKKYFDEMLVSSWDLVFLNLNKKRLAKDTTIP